MRRIYAQGDLDGACFLYSIVNAYVALRHEEPEFAEVCKAFGQVDCPGDFLNGMVGTTGSYDKDYALLEKNIVRVLAILGLDRFLVRRIPGPLSADMLEELVGANSVALIRYQGNSANASGMDHWACVVAYGRQNHSAHLACSVRRQQAFGGQGPEYVETFHESCGRWSNDLLTDRQDYAFIAEEVFQIALKP